MDPGSTGFSVTELFAPRHGVTLYVLIVVSLIIGILAFVAMKSTPTKYRKTIVMAVTFLAGLFYSVEFFWRGNLPGGDNPLSAWLEPVGNAATVIGAFTLMLGVINLLMIHGKAIQRRRSGWYNSAGFFAALFTMVIVSLTPFVQSEVLGGTASPAFQTLYRRILFDGMLAPLGATMFSLIAFYIVSASYRAFRLKSGEATLMMLAAFIVMLGMVPVGIYLTHWLPQTGILSAFRMENVTQWILTGPNAAAQRGITFGIAVGMLAMALRIWLSLEKGSYFDK